MRHKIYGLFFLTFLLCSVAIPCKAQKLVNLSPADFLAGINATPNAQIIDLRTPKTICTDTFPAPLTLNLLRSILSPT
jgi:hypothetical protein